MGLAAGASETEIRQRYLELVREFPPTGAGAFRRGSRGLRKSCATRLCRLHAQLFSIDPGNDSIEAIAADLRARLRDTRLPVDVLLSLAESS